jgi:outer membrane lipoprotein-sorting protein
MLDYTIHIEYERENVAQLDWAVCAVLSLPAVVIAESSMRVLCLSLVLAGCVPFASLAATPLRSSATRQASPAPIVHLRAQFVEHQGEEVMSGTVVLGGPGQMRWERQQPYRELLVINPRQAWHVDPDLNQAMRLDPRAVSAWTALLTSSHANPNYVASRNDGVLSLRRAPSALAERWPNLDVTTDAAGRLKRVVFVEEEGHAIEFSNWEPAPKVSFTFTPPAGMDVFGQ